MNCSICLEHVGPGDFELDCGHLFHSICLDEWILKFKKDSCPNCRYKLEYEVINRLIDNRLTIVNNKINSVITRIMNNK